MSIWEAWALGRKVLELSALFSTSKLNQWVSPNTIFKFHVRGLIFLWFILFVCVPLMKIIYSWFLLVFVDRTQKLPAYLLWKYVVLNFDPIPQQVLFSTDGRASKKNLRLFEEGYLIHSYGALVKKINYSIHLIIELKITIFPWYVKCSL